MIRAAAAVCVGLMGAVSGFTQNSANRAEAPPPASTGAAGTQPGKEPKVSDKWKHFVKETFTPLSLASGAFNAGFSQATNSEPHYGLGAGAFAERFGASNADNLTQNFFGDFVMASAFHEDTIYVRKGPAYGGLWKRAAYAISRAIITRKDSGGDTFNWSNVTGTAMSAGVSNLYYPLVDRTAEGTAIHFATSFAGAGFANLYPEFWPDFRGALARHHLWPHGR